MSCELNVHVNECDTVSVETRSFNTFISVKITSGENKVVYFFDTLDEALRMAQELLGSVYAAIAIKELNEQ